MWTMTIVTFSKWGMNENSSDLPHLLVANEP
jgi:hypothetical protein